MRRRTGMERSKRDIRRKYESDGQKERREK